MKKQNPNAPNPSAVHAAKAACTPKKVGKTIAENCEKGMKVLVHGSIHYTMWSDATGTDRYGCEIIAEKVDFLSRPKSVENENPELVDRNDEIPF